MDMDVHVMRENRNFSFIDVTPGEWVVIKPNLVKEAKENDPAEWESVITSGCLIEAVCGDVCRKLSGKGRVTICDAPQTDSSFKKIAERLDLHGIAERCQADHGVPVEVVDLRNEEWVSEGGIITERRRLAGDPNGSIAFNLGKESLFYRHSGEGRYYGADYDAGVVNSHHHGEVHEYLICATPVLADVFINMPKMKTHKKTGVTLSLKNLVGINADKNWLPHHTEGAPKSGGDQFPDLGARERLEQGAVGFARNLARNVPVIGPKVAQKLRKAGTAAFGDGGTVIRSGNWHGNDTTWRMVLDLNRCLLFGNPDGTLRRDRPKRYYTVVDGIVGMEGMGPMQGDPVRSGIVVGGTDPVATDLVAARVMGFDWRKIPVIREAFRLESLPITAVSPEEIQVVSDVEGWSGTFPELAGREFLRFEPHFGWKGHVEYDERV
jgi:uncharacterized protein (DUF362 family)